MNDSIKNRKTTFNSRESYLEYRRQWKETYRYLSASIRNIRLHWKDLQRNPTTGYDPKNKEWTRGREWTVEEQKRVAIAKTAVVDFGEHTDLSKLATGMLEELAAAKVEAQRQYVEAKKKQLEKLVQA